MSIDGFAIGRCSIRQGEESSDAAIPRGAPISGATSHCPETGQPPVKACADPVPSR
jgi:hypothetical protein